MHSWEWGALSKYFLKNEGITTSVTRTELLFLLLLILYCPTLILLNPNCPDRVLSLFPDQELKHWDKAQTSPYSRSQQQCGPEIRGTALALSWKPPPPPDLSFFHPRGFTCTKNTQRRGYGPLPKSLPLLLSLTRVGRNGLGESEPDSEERTLPYTLHGR